MASGIANTWQRGLSRVDSKPMALYPIQYPTYKYLGLYFVRKNSGQKTPAHFL